MTDEEPKENVNVKKAIVCKYYMLNKCNKNEKCEFLHDPEKLNKTSKPAMSQYQAYLNYTNTDCWMFNYGKCTNGCTFKHNIKSEEDLEEIIPLPERYLEIYFNSNIENILMTSELTFLKNETRNITKKIYGFELPVLNILQLNEMKNNSLGKFLNHNLSSNASLKSIDTSLINSNNTITNEINLNNENISTKLNFQSINQNQSKLQNDLFQDQNLVSNIPNNQIKRDSFTYQINNNIGNINYISNIKIFNNYVEENKNFKIDFDHNIRNDISNTIKKDNSYFDSKQSSFISKKSGKDLKSLLKPKIKEDLNNYDSESIKIGASNNVELSLNDNESTQNKISNSNFIKRCLSEEGLKNLVNIRNQQSSSNSILSFENNKLLGNKHSSRKNLNDCFNKTTEENDDIDSSII